MNKLEKEFKEAVAFYPEVSSVHPACMATPWLSDEDFKRLDESIRDSGLAHDLSVDEDGVLIDGRHRLLSCFRHDKEPRFKVSNRIDPWGYVYATNFAHRNSTKSQIAMFANRCREEENGKAKKRVNGRPSNRGESGGISTTTPPSMENGKARDVLGARFGVSGTLVDMASSIAKNAPKLVEKVEAGEMTIQAANKEALKVKRSKQSQPASQTTMLGVVAADEMATIVTVSGKTKEIKRPKSPKFNKTNNNVDWASWTWNPVTGCEHGCPFCYAREIANNDRMSSVYPFKFEPAYHDYRLSAPANTKLPLTDREQDGRVFVCSMADLFGKWVPTSWIRSVFEACLESPEWCYLFLTKWPARYSQMPLLENAWFGASIVQQSDVKRVEKSMAKFDTNCTKWISLEPMLGPIEFGDISWCDLVVIGSQTSTVQPEGFVDAIPAQFDWVVDVVNQCREADVPYYLKGNLGDISPGMELPKMAPRQR